MSHVTRGRLSHQVRKTCAKERSVDRLPFSHLLDPDRVRHLIEELGGLGRRCVLCPVTIFFGFLVQVTSADQSCQQAATDLLAWLAVSRDYSRTFIVSRDVPASGSRDRNRDKRVSAGVAE